MAAGLALAPAEAAVRHDYKPTCEVHPQERAKVLPCKSERGFTAGGRRTEEDDSRELARRIDAQVAYSLIEREQHTRLDPRSGENNIIRRPRDAFLLDRVRIVTCLPEIVQELYRKILVKL